MSPDADEVLHRLGGDPLVGSGFETEESEPDYEHDLLETEVLE